MTDYKPTEHGNLRQDGEIDQRTQQTSFAQGKVDPVEAGKKGGQSTGTPGGSGGSGDSAGAAHQGGDGLRKDGQPDQRLKQNQ